MSTTTNFTVRRCITQIFNDSSSYLIIVEWKDSKNLQLQLHPYHWIFNAATACFTWSCAKVVPDRVCLGCGKLVKFRHWQLFKKFFLTFFVAVCNPDLYLSMILRKAYQCSCSVPITRFLTRISVSPTTAAFLCFTSLRNTILTFLNVRKSLWWQRLHNVVS